MVRIHAAAPVLGYIQQTTSNDVSLVRSQHFPLGKLAQLVEHSSRMYPVLFALLFHVVEFRFCSPAGAVRVCHGAPSLTINQMSCIIDKWKYSKVVMQHLHTVPIVSSNLTTSTNRLIRCDHVVMVAT